MKANKIKTPTKKEKEQIKKYVRGGHSNVGSLMRMFPHFTLNEIIHLISITFNDNE